jgi:hypothetical protein
MPYLATSPANLTATHVTAALKAAGAGSSLVMPAHQIADAFNDAINKYGDGLFATINSYAALVSECMMESAYFRTTQEYASTGAYQPYRGRTFIQITWKDNYAAFGKWCLSVGLVADADYFVKNPTKLADLKWAAIGGVWYFTKVLKKDKQGNLHPIVWWADDPLAIGRAVNMGNPYSTATPNGQKARDAAYVAVVNALTPKEPDVSVAFRGGRTCSCVATSLPLVEQDMIRRGLIKYNIDIFQLGYRTDVIASAGTHRAGGCTDVAQRSAEHIKVWREWGWTMQDRSAAFPNDQHAHGWPYRCSHLAPDAAAQERDWDNRDAGLVGTGRVGGMWPIDDWKTAMKKRLAEQAERDRQKELELPTTAEVTTAVVKALATDKTFLTAIANAVMNADVVPNTFTSNVDNVNVATKSSLSLLGARVATLTEKVDALAAAVAAAFPEPTPEPTPPAA